MRVMITGASGLLGNAVCSRMKDSAELLPLAHSNASEGMLKIDLTSNIEELDSRDWDAVVHCAAQRSPDYCEENPIESSKLNIEVSEKIAKMAARRSAKMIHISTDYVFDGTNPPYSESDIANPVNHYGITKLEAEKRVMGDCPEATILRIPALYGNPPAPLTSTLIQDGINAVYSKTTMYEDNIITRFPTYTEDIANVIKFLLNSDFHGIIHASAPEKTTRYQWALTVASILNRDASHIKKSENDPERKANRPIDSQLATDKLKEIGGPLPRGYSEILPKLLEKFKK